MKKRILSAMLAVGMALSLTACGTTFDASGYVKSCLDAAYHEEYEEYAEFIDTTVEEAKADLEQQNQDVVDTEIASLGISVTDEQKEQYLTMLLEVEHLTKYEVGEAVETDDGFEVPVTIYPVDTYENFVAGIETVYQEAANAGELTEETIFPIMLEYLQECIDNVQYKDAVETTMHVTQGSDEIWQISDEEMYTIDDLLLPGI